MRRILAVFALAFSCLCLASAEDRADVVVLLDSSESMFPYFEPVVEYIVTKVARDYLRQGDTFHLITFSDDANLEMVQTINKEEDVRSVISRLYLVYPFGKNTDLLSAVDYLKQYVQVLPKKETRLIVIITDGVHSPAASSPFIGYDDARAMQALTSNATDIGKLGWKVSIIRIPFNAADATSQKDNGKLDPSLVIKGLEDALNIQRVDFDPQNPDSVAQNAVGLPSVEFPTDLGKKDAEFSFSIKVHNASLDKLNLELRRVFSGGENILTSNSFLKLRKGESGKLKISLRVPESLAEGPVEMPIRLEFAEGQRVSPPNAILRFTLSRSPTSALLRNSIPIVLFIIILAAVIALIIIIIILLRHMPAKASSTVVEAVKASAAEEEASAGKTVSSAHGTGKNRAAASQPGPSTRGSGSPAPALGALQAKSVAEARDNNKIPLATAEDSLVRANRVNFETAAKVSASSTGGYAIAVTELPDETKARHERKLQDEIAEREGSARADALMSSLSVKKAGSITLQMTIDRQNPNIGLRNVHSMKSGSRLGIGGGKAAAFSIFVVKVPRRLAEVYFDGESCVLVPIRKDYFPDIQGSLPDCLDKEIKVLTPEGFSMRMRISRWVSPTDRWNKILHIIEMKGLV